jgi:hypothetical protein
MNTVRLFESYKSQKELEILAQEIMKRASKAIFRRFPNEEDQIKSVPNVVLEQLSLEFESRVTLEPEIDEYEEIADFIKNSGTWIYFLPKGYRGTTSQGDFHYDEYWKTRKIRIYLKKETFEDFNRVKEQGFEILKDPEISEEDKKQEFNDQMYRFYLYQYESVLLHELQHAYDDYRSKGKAIRHSDEFQDKKQKYLDIMNTDMARFLNDEQMNMIQDYQKDYLNLKHEVDARFAQAIKKTDMLDTDHEYWDKYDDLKVVIKPFDDVLKNFKYNMLGYKELSEEEQRRILRKLGQFYELEKDFIKDMNRRNGVKESNIKTFEIFKSSRVDDNIYHIYKAKTDKNGRHYVEEKWFDLTTDTWRIKKFKDYMKRTLTFNTFQEAQEWARTRNSIERIR